MHVILYFIFKSDNLQNRRDDYTYIQTDVHIQMMVLLTH